MTGVEEGAAIAAWIGAAAAVAGTATAAYGQYQAGQREAESSRYNAQIAENQAQAARNAASVAEQQTRERNRRILARQRSIVGASGLQTEGSPLAVMMDSVQQAELDALNARYSGELGAYGQSLEAEALRRRGGNLAAAGAAGAGTTLLTGAATAAGFAARGYRASGSDTPYPPPSMYPSPDQPGAGGP